MKYIKIIAIQCVASIISAYLLLLIGNISLQGICIYSFAAFMISIFILIPAIIIEKGAEKNINRQEVKEKSNDLKEQEWLSVNFTDVNYITSFIIIVFFTAFITKIGTDAASLIKSIIIMLVNDNMKIIDDNIMITIALFLPSIVPFTLIYFMSCTTIYEKYRDYKKMIN